MHRTVHRFQPKLNVFQSRRRKHRVGIILLVSADMPELAFGDVRREDDTVSPLNQLIAQVIFHLLANNRAFWMPEDQALSVLLPGLKTDPAPCQVAYDLASPLPHVA